MKLPNARKLALLPLGFAQVRHAFHKGALKLKFAK